MRLRRIAMVRVKDWLKNYIIKNESGVTLVEIIVAIAIFSIFIIPIFSMVLTSGNNTANSKRYYDATVMSENLSEEIKKKITEKLAKYDPLHDTTIDDPIGQKGVPVEIDSFLEMTESAFNNIFKANDYYYEVYIKEIDATTDSYSMGDPTDLYILKKGPMTVPVVEGDSFPATPLNTVDFTLLSENYVTYFKSEYTYDSTYNYNPTGDPSKIVEDLTFGYINGTWNTAIPKNGTDITIKYDGTKRKYDIKVGKNPTLNTTDVIRLNIDMTRANDDLKNEEEMLIRVENESKAKVIISTFRSTDQYDDKIKILPIQKVVNDGDQSFEEIMSNSGNIYVEMNTKFIPRKNYLIKIIVRDARQSQNGKILKEMIDIYAHDYRILTY